MYGQKTNEVASMHDRRTGRCHGPPAWFAVALFCGAIAGYAHAAPSMYVDYHVPGTAAEDRPVINHGDTIILDDTQIGDQVVFSFLIRDFGDQTLNVEEVRTAQNSVSVGDHQGTVYPVQGDFPASAVFDVIGPGQASVIVVIESNDPTTPGFAFFLQTLGVAADLLVTKDLDVLSEEAPIELAPVEIGRTVVETAELSNQGTGQLRFIPALDPVTLTDLTGGDVADFSVDLNAPVIAPGGFAEMTIEFTPTSAGRREILAEIASNDPDSPYRFKILAEGLEPEIEIIDCNFNGIDDAQDLANATSYDCNSNGTPDECELDTDEDGVIDDCDECPGYDDALDTDEDGVADCIDGCPEDAEKTDPGVCGCGAEDYDADEDGAIDCIDECPEDAYKTAPGTCGCGVEDYDTDEDGTMDCVDECPEDAEKTEPGTCGCGVDDTDPFCFLTCPTVCSEMSNLAGPLPLSCADPCSDEPPDNDVPTGPPCICGACGSAMIPLLFLGLCGFRSRRVNARVAGLIGGCAARREDS